MGVCVIAGLNCLPSMSACFFPITSNLLLWPVERHPSRLPSRPFPWNGLAYSVLVLRRSRTLLEHLPIPDSAFSCIARQLEVLCQFKRIHRTGILTEPTEHAARKVVGKRRQVLAASLLVPYAGHHNQVFRTGQGAKIAGDAKSFISVGINVEPWRAPIAFSYFGPFGWVLFGVDIFGTLIAKCNPQPLEQVDEKDRV